MARKSDNESGAAADAAVPAVPERKPEIPQAFRLSLERARHALSNLLAARRVAADGAREIRAMLADEGARAALLARLPTAETELVALDALAAADAG